MLRQRFFSLAFFLFKADALEHGVKKPCVTFLNELDIVQLLLDKDRRIGLLLYNMLFKCLSCFPDDKHLNGNIFEHLEVRGVQSVQRQLSGNTQHIQVSPRGFFAVLMFHNVVKPVHHRLVRCSIKIEDLREYSSVWLRHWIRFDPIA